MPTHINLALQNAIAIIKWICDRPGSRSQDFPYGGRGYKSSVSHYFESSCEIAACAVQPASVEDVCEIMEVIKDHRVPFAVKGGGHTTNPRFSSTTGIQIDMCRFNNIVVDIVDTENKLVHVGPGCLLDELYREVVPRGLNIVGGSSVSGVGIAGWLLGGGYSLKTNQYSLGIDNLAGVQIVLPSGKSKRVGKSSEEEEDKELFWAIKGGGNNFGIVTEFTLEAHDQGKVSGGLLVYDSEHYEDVKVAVAKFALHTDPKAAIVAAFRYFNNPGGVESILTVQCFYDGVIPSANLFADFLDIDHRAVKGGGDSAGHETPPPSSQIQYSSYQMFDAEFSSFNEIFDTAEIDEETLLPVLDGLAIDHDSFVDHHSFSKARSFTSASNNMDPQSQNVIKRSMVGIGENPRGRWGNVMVDVYTKDIIDEVGRQASKASKHMTRHGGKRVVIDIWPFTASMFNKRTDCAWPHEIDKPNGPILAYFLWEGSENDNFWITTMKSAWHAIKKKVVKARPGAEKLPVYLNTTLDSTTVEEIYRDNLTKLKSLRRKFDPLLVMNLAGGFKIPH